MNNKLYVTAALCLISTSIYATPVTSLPYVSGSNSGYSVAGISASADANTDWFVFDSDGVTSISFWFDRATATNDLFATLYRGDTNGFDYEAALGCATTGCTGPGYSDYSNQAQNFNTALRLVANYDDEHQSPLNPLSDYGDPDFARVLAAGTYSLAVSSWDEQGGAYTFSTNVPEPASIGLLASGLIGFAATRRKQKLA